jgi:hypothetical protein
MVTHRSGLAACASMANTANARISFFNFSILVKVVSSISPRPKHLAKKSEIKSENNEFLNLTMRSNHRREL